MTAKPTPARVTIAEAARLRGVSKMTAWRRYRKFAVLHADGKMRVALERVLADKISEDPESPLLPEVKELRDLIDALSIGMLKIARRLAALEMRVAKPKNSNAA